MLQKTTLSKVIVGVLCAMLLAAGCGDDGDNNGSNNGAEQATASFTTYNVGLARGFVDYASDRTQPVADAVAQLDTDVVCMQEAWLYQDNQMEWNTGQIDAIVNASADTFPHSYLEVTESTGEDLATCNNDDTEPMEACVAANCGDVSNDNLATCALGNCGTEFNALSGDCQECISVNLGGSIDQIIGACTGDVGGSAYSYGGHNGLLMLSKHEMTNTEYISLDSAVVQRAVLHATVDIPDFGAADVYCTHLQADLSDSLPYPEGGDFASYEEEQAAQIDAINAYIDETAETDNVVLLGDMNTGPATGGLSASFPDNYAKFTEAGFSNAYLDQDDPQCTYCGSNSLNEGDAELAIDHVLADFATAVGVAGTERVLDETQSISTADGDMELHLSDHYGVTTTFQLE
jgi:endonuclease/exonuclease/phosphatase family metal-dependent hydrolase